MPRTRDQLQAAATDAEAWLDALDPAIASVDDTNDLRQIAGAMSAVAGAEAKLTDAVAAARANGRSWPRIAMVLGVSKQAARQRYGAPSEVLSADI